MSRPQRWTEEYQDNGILQVKLSSWKYFHDLVRQKMLFYSHVWRGDRCDDRPLLPTFDRKYIGRSQKSIERRLERHLGRFKLAVCGRRGANPPKIESENDWWALGQHYGLESPLLDWTRSPFVALFFAFEKVKEPQTACRAVYAVSPDPCQRRNPGIMKKHAGPLRPDIVEFFTPLQDDNNRLVNQNGLFSRCTPGKPLDTWVSTNFQGLQGKILIKIYIPDQNRRECLRTLNRMNINHLTLFPDVSGASNFCNTADTIYMY